MPDAPLPMVRDASRTVRLLLTLLLLGLFLLALQFAVGESLLTVAHRCWTEATAWLDRVLPQEYHAVSASLWLVARPASSKDLFHRLHHLFDHARLRGLEVRAVDLSRSDSVAVTVAPRAAPAGSP